MRSTLLAACLLAMFGCVSSPSTHQKVATAPSGVQTAPVTTEQAKAVDQGQTAPPLVWSQIHVHAATSIFSGMKLPEIRVNWMGKPRATVEGFSVHTVYYDARFHPTTQASAPGRYGAVVTITTDGGRTLRRYLTLFRTPQPVNWDYIRLPIHVKFPPQFGVDNEVAAENHENLSEFFKYQMQSAAEYDSAPAIIMAGLYEATPAGEHFAQRNGFEARDEKWWHELREKVGLPGLPYQVHVPKDYAAKPAKKYPVIMFLHGSGEGGDGGEDLNKISKWGLPHMFATGEGVAANLPFIVVWAQEPMDVDWSPYEVDAIMAKVEQDYRVDVDREYLTGLSLGGYGTWDTAIAFPHRFAAVAVMSGAGDPGDVERIKDLPVWIFHGQLDPVVPVYEAHRMFDALQKIGGRVRMTIEPNAYHNSWTYAYNLPELYAWFLQQRRGQPMQPTTKPGM
jgi:predicted esterase